MTLESTAKPLCSGTWTDELKWEFYSTNVSPQLHLCSAVFCLPFQEQKILLVENAKRSWEMPGGHIEEYEDEILKTMEREVLEEGRISIKNPKLIGYRKIIATVPQKKRESDGMYPFPFSYIPFYTAEISALHHFNDQSEIKQRKFFSREEAIKALQRDSNYKIVEYAYSLLNKKY